MKTRKKTKPLPPPPLPSLQEIAFHAKIFGAFLMLGESGPGQNQALEFLLMAICKKTGASKGAILYLAHDERAEVIAAIPGDRAELARMLRVSAKRIADGDGMPLGDDGLMLS